MSIKKQYLKTRPICKATFRLDREVVQNAGTVHLVGEFNNWNTDRTPMNKLKSGAFTITLELEPNREYQFRYLIDQRTWINDPESDKYVPTQFSGTDNSAITL